MATVKTFQSNFSKGAQSPDVAAREDIESYFNGARTLLNVIPSPQGGIKNRAGLRFIADLPGDQNYRLIPFSYSEDSFFILVFYAGTIRVYDEDTLKDTVSSTGYTDAQIPGINYIHSNNSIILLHPEVQPKILTRVTDTNWTIDNVAFAEIPTYEFGDPTTTVLSLTARTGTGVTATTSASQFGPGDVGKIIVGAFGGRAEITAYTSPTQVTVSILHSFPIAEDGVPADPPDDLQPAEWAIEEDAWSGTRGWPRAGCFFGSRLWLAGTSSLPQRVWGSTSFSYFTFDEGKGRDADSFFVENDSDQTSIVYQLWPFGHLIGLSNADEFFISSRPATPEDHDLQRTTGRGSADIRPVEVDEELIYIQSGGKALRGLVFLDEIRNYSSSSLSLLASHLMIAPVQMVYRKATEDDENDLVHILNDPNGTNPDAGSLTTVATLRKENITAFCQLKVKDAEILAIGVDEKFNQRQVYCVVRRGTAVTLERFDPDHFLDESIRDTSGMPKSVFTGLSRFDGEEIDVMVDGSYYGTVTPSGGSVTLDYDATVSAEFGRRYDVLYENMPVSPLAPNATLRDRKKRIVKVFLELLNTTSLGINGKTMSLVDMWEAYLDTDPPPYTGMFEYAGIRGRTEDPVVQLTMPNPGTLHILGVGLKVAF